MPEEKPSLEAVTLHCLRYASGWSQQELAADLGFSVKNQLTRYEREGKSLSREYLGKLLVPLDLPPEAPDVMLWALGLIFPEPLESETGDPLALTSAERGRIHCTVLAAEWSRAEDLCRSLGREKRARKAAAARRESEVLAERLKSASARDRQNLIAVFPEFRTWAVAEALAHASARAARHGVAEALELAELALAVAWRVPGKAWRARTVAYCTGFLANVYRVATEFDEASAVFARAWALWREGEAAASLPLAEWRLLDLEASLRREQQRFPEALERLEWALALSGGQPVAAGRILLKKEQTLYQMGDVVGALAALEQATPLVEAAGDRHQLFALRFKTVKHLCSQESYTAAEALLPAVREMAIEEGKRLDLLRVAWLATKVDSGQGREEEAIAGLEQLTGDFTALKLPYEAALASLDLAVLHLQGGGTAEVKSLAGAMTWIFDAKGIAREALAALSLFCEAARQETATVELAKRVIAVVEKPRRSASPA